MQIDRRAFMGGAALSTGWLAACQESATAPKAVGSPDAGPLIPLRNYANRHIAAWGLPGLTVVVVTREGYEGFVRAGYADLERKVPVGPDHLFQIGSISKMFTALATWSLIEEGRLSPDVKVLDALKGLEIGGGDDIRLQHLLNHTAGLPADSAIFIDGGLWTGFAPGTDWSYSNCGYELAGKIAADADGRPYPEMVKARVLDKLGMRDSVSDMRVADRPRYAQGYEPALTDRLNPVPGRMTPTAWVDSDSPAGCIAVTGADMAKFLRFLLELAGGKSGPVLSDTTAKRFLANPVDGWGPGAKYGNGLARVTVDGRNYLHHTGGMISFCSALHVDPEAGVAAFVSANVHYSLDYRPSRLSIFACELMRSLKEGAPAPTPKPPRDVLKDPVTYAGVFVAADGDMFEIAVVDEALRLRKKGRDSALQQAAGDLFATTEPDHSVTGVVIERENGQPVRAWCGETEYLVDPSIGYRPPAPDALRMLAGRYDTDDKWGGPLYVYVRDGKVLIGNIEELTPMADGLWHYGDTSSPERVRFDGYINGVPQRLMFSGTPFIRRFS